jgi:hypothetical protein
VLAALLAVVLAAPPVAGGEPADGVVWGRLVLEEESPDGAWTPMPGAEVQLYPASPTLVAELERIRHGARDSLRSHDTAADRLQATLRSHQAAAGNPATMRDGAPGPVLRGVTDPAGIFVIEAVPAGTWLLVAVRISPYAGARLRAPAPASPRRGGEPEKFVPRVTVAPKEAEIWLTEVRITPGERVALELTDRARWFAGPVH